MSFERTLERAVEEIAEEVGGRVGVSARHVARGLALDLNADERFPSASVIKVPILVALMAAVEEGALALDDRVSLQDADRTPGSGVLQMLHTGVELTLRDLAHLMITVSDNTASNMLIDRLSCDRVNACMDALGMRQTRLGRKFYDFEARDRGLDNWASARELVELLTAMERREVVSRSACEEMLAMMRKQQLDGKIPRLLPPNTPVANKTGSISSASHDVGIIYSPAGALALAVLTRDIDDPAAAEGAIRHVARLVYHYWGRA